MKLTKELIESKIKKVEYLVKDLEEDPCLTLCFITMNNGFISTGQSACIDASDYVYEDGIKYAYEQAFSKLWELEAYLAKEEQYKKDQRMFYVDVGLLPNEKVKELLQTLVKDFNKEKK